MYKKFRNLFLFLAVLAIVHVSEGMVKSVEALLQDQKKEIWQDLKGCDFYRLESQSELCQLISKYNAIEKTDKQNAPERIKLLEKIKNLTQNPHSSEEQLIHQTASNKAYYLEQLLKLREKAVDRAFRIIDTPKGKMMGRGIQGKYEGEWVLHLDPAFRDKELYKEFLRWKELLKSHPTLPDFYFWLEGQHAYFSVDEAYARSETREPHFLQNRLVVFDENGKAYTIQNGDRSQKPLIVSGISYYPVIPRGNGSSSESGYLYNIDRIGRLYISSTGPHSTILHGDTLLAAGWINFNPNSFISYINTASGHYTPSATHLKKALELMEEYYINPNIFMQMRSYMVEGGPLGQSTLAFEGAKNISNTFADRGKLSFFQLYEKKDQIPKDLWDEIHLYYHYQMFRRGVAEVRQTLGELFEQMEKMDWAKEQEIEKEILQSDRYLEAMTQVQARLTPESKKTIRDLVFRELPLKKYLSHMYKDGIFSEDPNTSTWFNRAINLRWDPSRNPDEAELLKRIKELPNQKGLHVVQEMGELYLKISQPMAWETPLNNMFVAELIRFPEVVRQIENELLKSGNFLAWEAFYNNLKAIFPEIKEDLFIEFEIKGQLKKVPITYRKELDDLQEKINGLIGQLDSYRDMRYPREWKKVSPQEWKAFSFARNVLSSDVIYTAPGKNLYALLNEPIRKKVQQVGAANTIKKALKIHLRKKATGLALPQ